MNRFEIRPIQEGTLPEIADFFVRWRRNEQNNSPHQTAADTNGLRIENVRYLRWLVLENPASNCATLPGYCVRGENETIAGAMLMFPSYFMLGEKRLSGLCGASIFVNEDAGIQAFIMFKKFVSTAGQDFYYSTTCNAKSGALWSKFRGRGHAIPNSESTFLLPYRVDKLAEAFAKNRNYHPSLVAVLRAAGKAGSAAVRLALRSSLKLEVIPSRDWEKLAELARIHRNPDAITNERSVRFLEWRYGQSHAGDHKEIYIYQDNQGNEGWFALGSGLIGSGQKLRAAELLDLVWARGKLDPSELLSAVVAQSYPASDALYMRPRPGVAFAGFSRFVMRSDYSSPQCYVMGALGQQNLDPALFDFTAADGDTWP